ncbi:phosphatidate cytidylyltransferase [bacterium]|nr:phosphatidate cytidylyltransferase [bacterium]
MASNLTNRLVLPLIILPLYWKLQSQPEFFALFTICIGILAFFSGLIAWMSRQGKKSAPELMARTVTFWWMVALFLISLTTPPVVTVFFLGMFSALALHEYLSFSDQRFSLPIRIFALLQVPINLALHYLGQSALSPVYFFLLAGLAVPTILVLENRPDSALMRYGYLVSGLAFFVFSLGYAAALARQAIMILLVCFFLTEIRDLSSYWLGKGLARLEQGRPWLSRLNPKIAPLVSPNKTWGVGVLSVLLLVALALALKPLLPGKNTASLLAWAALIGFLGLIGDLVFSMFKRQFGLKDSGQSMPGSTGLIDRIDALVLTIPATYFFFQTVPN